MPDKQFCERCGKELNPKTSVWLELNSNTGLYHHPGELGNSIENQGGFSFGPDCAKAVLKERSLDELAESKKSH